MMINFFFFLPSFFFPFPCSCTTSIHYAMSVIFSRALPAHGFAEEFGDEARNRGLDCEVRILLGALE